MIVSGVVIAVISFKKTQRLCSIPFLYSHAKFRRKCDNLPSLLPMSLSRSAIVLTALKNKIKEELKWCHNLIYVGKSFQQTSRLKWIAITCQLVD